MALVFGSYLPVRSVFPDLPAGVQQIDRAVMSGDIEHSFPRDLAILVLPGLAEVTGALQASSGEYEQEVR